MKQISIREAVISDISKLLEFEQGVVDAERPFNRYVREDGVIYYDIEKLITDASAHLLVAELDGQLIGSGYAEIEVSSFNLKHERHTLVGFIYVDSAHRGKRVSQMIIENLLAWSKKQGVCEISLQVYHENIHAVRVYEKLGFSKHKIEMRMSLD